VGRLAAGLFAVALLAFVLPARLPGGTESGLLGPRSTDPAARAALRHELHLDRAPPIAFVAFLTDAARGDLGRSPVTGVDVGAVVGERAAGSAALAAAAGAIAFACVLPRRRRRRAQGRMPDDAPSSSFVPGAVWVLPLLAAVAVAVRFGVVPAPGAHAALGSRVGAGLLPAGALGAAIAVWTTDARRTARDIVAAVLVGTIVTEAVFGLPGLGTLLRDAAVRPDPLMLRGALLVLSVVAVVAGVVFVSPRRPRNDLGDGPTNRRRAASGTLATLWVVALVVATMSRLHVRLASPSRTDLNGLGRSHGVSSTHPFGTDVLGRDVLARVLATARGSLLLVVAAMVVATIIGSAIGAVVAFAGGRVERAGIAFLAGWATFPGELVALTLLAFNGRDGNQTAFALAFVAAPSIAFGTQRRMLDALRRSNVAPGGDGWVGSVASQASPNLLRAALATMFVGASRVVVTELVAGLLGLGPAATQTWSHEVSMQLAYAAHAPWAVIAPAVVALVTAIALAGLGNAIRPPRRA
jgi:peptide/nickel transport system permease protein